MKKLAVLLWGEVIAEALAYYRGASSSLAALSRFMAASFIWRTPIGRSTPAVRVEFSRQSRPMTICQTMGASFRVNWR